MILDQLLSLLEPFKDKYEWEVIKKTNTTIYVCTPLEEPVLISHQYKSEMATGGQPIVNQEFETYTVRLRPIGSLETTQNYGKLQDSLELTEKLLSIASKAKLTT